MSEETFVRKFAAVTLFGWTVGADIGWALDGKWTWRMNETRELVDIVSLKLIRNEGEPTLLNLVVGPAILCVAALRVSDA